MAQSQSRTVADLGEFALIDRLTNGLPASPAVSVGPGDDAAVFLVNGSAVTSVDLFVEGVHFRRDWSEPFDVGRKVVAGAVADLEAMGATPVALTVGLALPRDLDVVWADQFAGGVRAEAERAGIALVGGDLSQAGQIVISASVVGQTDAWAPVRRDGAGPGALIVGTSTLLPGRIGEEFAVTRGHLHAQADRAELYYCLAGRGVMLLETLDGESRTLPLTPGQAVPVPGYWIHRSINVGDEPFVPLFCYNADAGQDYTLIAAAGGMATLVVADPDGGWTTRANPRHLPGTSRCTPGRR